MFNALLSPREQLLALDNDVCLCGNVRYRIKMGQRGSEAIEILGGDEGEVIDALEILQQENPNLPVRDLR